MLRYSLRRIKSLGFKQSIKRIHYRLAIKMFDLKWRSKALQHQASSTWQTISSKHDVDPDFSVFLLKLSKNNTLDHVYHNTLLKKFLPSLYTSKKMILEQANLYAQNQFSFLGARNTSYNPVQNGWHHDIKINKLPSQEFTHINNNYLTENLTCYYYRDIAIQSSSELSLDHYDADIKVPWELSRMQHFFTLGQAHQINPNDNYIHTFAKHLTSWIDNNPFLLGVNWVCPMEVAIRAINIIWGWHFFKHEATLNAPFWEKIICSLYDHALYLENNWETSDRPNNHYLSDLLGFIYLTFFFDMIPTFKKKQKPFITKLIEQFDKQIAKDGTSYEGSTMYHQLVTEIYLHLILLSRAHDFPLSQAFSHRFNQMTSFIRGCNNGSKLIQIGDNDSGKIVTGLNVSNTLNENKVMYYQNFGISIIKHNDWHVTFRHPTFESDQPSGHFHNDQLSITLSIKNQPLLIDPGSYLYTANGNWRNYFRSFANHNTFFIPYFTDKDFKQAADLFQLPRATHPLIPPMQETDETTRINNHYKLISNPHITAHRNLVFNRKTEILLLEDWFETAYHERLFSRTKDNQKSIGPLNGKQACWSFIFAPGISLDLCGSQTWVVSSNSNKIAIITSTLPLIITSGYYSPEYGSRQKCLKLTALKTIKPHLRKADTSQVERTTFQRYIT